MKNTARLMRSPACFALALASTAHAADKVKVGFMSTLSGPGAAIGVDIRDGFELVARTTAAS